MKHNTDFDIIRHQMLDSEAPYEGEDALYRIEKKFQEARRIFMVLQKTGPMVPIQEAGAIEEWLK